MGKKVLKSGRFWVGIIGLAFCLSAIFAQMPERQEYEFTPRFTMERARVLSVDNSRLSPDPIVEGLYLGRQTVEVEVLSGVHRGRQVRFENTLSRFFNYPARENMTMVVQIDTQNEQIVRMDVQSFSRGPFIFIFIGLFLLILLLVGRRKGLYSALSLIFTLIVVLFFMIPLIIRGHSPIFMAVVTAALTSMFSIFIVANVSMKSLAAICGTFAGVTIAGIASVLAGRFGHISGMQLEHAEMVILQAGDAIINVPQLLSAGIIIAALGATIDVGMSIAAAVFEMKVVNPELDARRLYKSGMNIGRDIMGTMSNTLILAFAGVSLTVLVLLVMFEFPYIQLINMNLLAIEIIQGISASIGLILTVPVTAALAAILSSDNRITDFLRNKIKIRGEGA